MIQKLIAKTNFFKYLILFGFAAFYATSPGFAINAESNENPEHTSHETQQYDLKKGKRLFYGLLKAKNGNTYNCVECHNTRLSDTLNWNPTAMEIAVSTSKMDSLQFANRINSPLTKKLSESHKDISLSGNELQLIRLYLDDFKTKGLEKPKPNITKLAIFIFLVILALFSVTDLILLKRIKPKWVSTVALVVSSLFILKTLAHEAILLGRSPDYAPLQPIKFSHKIHALDNQIDCQYCHFAAEIGKSAAIPSANLCLNCHTLVREGTKSGRFEINKIHTAIQNKQAIEWVRIHRLPDFVYFNHAQHVGVGKLACEECHGKVEEMDVLSQLSDLSMGWCLDCHRTRKVQFIENEYYGKTFEELWDKIAKGGLDSVTVVQIGGDDCMKCHY